MIEIVALDEYVPTQTNTMAVFLAGGISGCSDWQKELAQMLGDEDIVLLNPRRPDFPIDDPDAARDQIEWEYHHLRLADAIVFWFPCETLCPITLFELGAWSMTEKPLIIGTHPEYARRQDVVIQMALARPEVKIMSSLEEIVDAARSGLVRIK